jgi:four helix bundle protein
MKINHFEDLECWKLGRDLSKGIYMLTRKPLFAKDYGLVDQVRRSAVSVMTNIAEGFEKGTNKDFVKYLYIARGSSGETRSLLYVALDQGYISADEFERSKSLCIRCSQVIYGLIQYLVKHKDWRTGEPS